MNRSTLERALEEAEIFIERCGKVRKLDDVGQKPFYGSKETAALRRQSMELTRALANLRKS